MAQQDDPFSDLGPDVKVMGQRTEPISDQERFILNNIFDTQPEKRKAYLKQIGFEMNPEDDNKVRPAGSDIPWENAAEIDPGVGAWFKKGGMKELFKDTTDVAYDMIVQNALVAGGTLGAGAAGTAAGLASGPGAAITGVLGGALGGALGNATAEGMKSFVGDIILEAEVPQDQLQTVIQSAVIGVMPSLMKGVVKGGGATINSMLELKKRGIINAIKSTGGVATPDLIQKAAKNPEMFTEEAVKGASKKLQTIYSEIFGTTIENPKSTRQIKDGAFSKVLKPLNDQADAELNRLSNEPAANWKVGELTGLMKRRISELSSKFGRGEEESAALSYMKNKVASLNFDAEKKLGKNITDEAIDQFELNFKEGRDVLKAIQTDAFGENPVPGASYLRQIIGGGPDQLRQMADQKAGKLGSKLPEINAKRAEILQFYKTAQQELTPSKITSAFVGNEDIQKEITKDTMAQMDQILGTQFTPAIETGAIQRIVNEMYKNSKTYGSGTVTTAALKGGLSGGLKAAGAAAVAAAPMGQSLPAAAVAFPVGAIYGAQKAATLANPANALKALQKVPVQQEALDQFIKSPVTRGAAGISGVQIGNVINDLNQPQVKEDEDPFADL